MSHLFLASKSSATRLTSRLATRECCPLERSQVDVLERQQKQLHGMMLGGSPSCATCSKAVYFAEQVSPFGLQCADCRLSDPLRRCVIRACVNALTCQVYHKPCLICKQCRKRLESGSWVQHDDEVRCVLIRKLRLSLTALGVMVCSMELEVCRARNKLADARLAFREPCDKYRSFNTSSFYPFGLLLRIRARSSSELKQYQ